MNAERIAQTLTYVPERQPRALTGSLVPPEGAGGRYADRLARLASLLHWLSPLCPMSLEDQQVLGLVGANGRPLHAADEDAEAPLDEVEDELV
jgi:hypothetical protein